MGFPLYGATWVFGLGLLFLLVLLDTLGFTFGIAAFPVCYFSGFLSNWAYWLVGFFFVFPVCGGGFLYLSFLFPEFCVFLVSYFLCFAFARVDVRRVLQLVWGCNVEISCM